MGLNTKSRTILIFEEYIQSKKTIEHYSYHINRFTKHYNLKDWDSILALENTDLKEKIEDYVIFFKNQDKSSNYIRVITFALQSLCDSNDKLGINWKKIRKLLGKKTRPKKSRPYTTEEIKRMLGGVKGLRNKALILFLSSSGVRRGAIPDMRIRDLKQMSYGCIAVTVYPDTDDEYVTFVNKEASDALSLYHKQRTHDGEKITPNSFVFRSIYKNTTTTPKKFDEKSISNVIFRAKHNAGIDADDLPNLLVHAFRRRFNTVLKIRSDANPTIIERLMGHDQKLDNSYFQPTTEQLFEEYQKGMADLTVDDSERLLVERREMQDELDKLEQEKSKSKELEIRLEDTEIQMKKLFKLLESGRGTIIKSDNNEFHVKLNQN
ncbi:Tyrosine recombinase XerD-like protein [Marine Group I thaumarchaeote SCGC AAA799-E16]|uniref:Tyrosine recombinase XerD-like protein n=4 Tax=Marine Group I TaxID=905826 RepID=A0A087S9B7_9ARCH|nr:Tyrosine recombinase XerD-like protein [Marine Group I thaumarchaeote SCGC AAA799-E16]KFM16452.1 Tyrosine recombinase XerD-like protein [Marine Group I thaumarchaeote SCGC AAA799-D11]KFM18418.1 integrase family protein [Marine Group I thaumarchaeote SCGC RSA3]KFM22321.1 Tyrosine recombinase XerD-like protein [Marine Group I thaumarchaeote SCGC AAA799-B03]